MRFRKWAVVARDVNGDALLKADTLCRAFTRSGAQRFADKWEKRMPIPEPLPGRPLYSLSVEEIQR